MEEVEPRECLDRVADGMAEVQDLPDAGLVLVLDQRHPQKTLAGRPKGKRVSEMSLKPAADRLDHPPIPPFVPPLHLLFVARRDGNQVIAYELEPELFNIEAQPDYLPLRRWEEKGLVAVGQQVYYDFEERWIPLGV